MESENYSRRIPSNDYDDDQDAADNADDDSGDDDDRPYNNNDDVDGNDVEQDESSSNGSNSEDEADYKTDIPLKRCKLFFILFVITFYIKQFLFYLSSFILVFFLSFWPTVFKINIFNVDGRFETL